MQKIKNLILSAICIGLILLQACGGSDDSPPTPEELRLEALAGTSGVTWIVLSATFEGSPSSDFDNSSITMRGSESSKTYTSTNFTPLLISSGTWDFNGTNLNQLIFDGNTDNVYAISNLQTETTPATLTITVNFTEAGGTIEGTNGTYVFNLQAQ